MKHLRKCRLWHWWLCQFYRFLFSYGGNNRWYGSPDPPVGNGGTLSLRSVFERNCSRLHTEWN